MHHKEPTTLLYPLCHPRYHAALGLIVTACFIMQAVGCVHQSASSAPPSRIEQSDKAKTVEKKSPIQKEKRSAASVEKSPGKKPEQLEEPNPDAFTPPPPLKPPTFGGAGG